MQIEWTEAEGLKLGGVVEAAGVAAHLCKDKSMAEVSRGRDKKKVSGGYGDRLRRNALKRAESAVGG